MPRSSGKKKGQTTRHNLSSIVGEVVFALGFEEFPSFFENVIVLYEERNFIAGRLGNAWPKLE